MKEKSARWVKCEIDIQKLYICVPEEGPARPPTAPPPSGCPGCCPASCMPTPNQAARGVATSLAHRLPGHCPLEK